MPSLSSIQLSFVANINITVVAKSLKDRSKLSRRSLGSELFYVELVIGLTVGLIEVKILMSTYHVILESERNVAPIGGPAVRYISYC